MANDGWSMLPWDGSFDVSNSSRRGSSSRGKQMARCCDNRMCCSRSVFRSRFLALMWHWSVRGVERVKYYICHRHALQSHTINISHMVLTPSVHRYLSPFDIFHLQLLENSTERAPSGDTRVTRRRGPELVS